MGPYISTDSAARKPPDNNSTKTSPRITDGSTLNTDRNPPSQREKPKITPLKNPPPIEARTSYNLKWQFFEGEDKEQAKMMRKTLR